MSIIDIKTEKCFSPVRFLDVIRRRCHVPSHAFSVKKKPRTDPGLCKSNRCIYIYTAPVGIRLVVL